MWRRISSLRGEPLKKLGIVNEKLLTRKAREIMRKLEIDIDVEERRFASERCGTAARGDRQIPLL